MAGDRTIAFDRFGLGARPDDSFGQDPRGWLLAQLASFDPTPPPIAAQPPRRALFERFRTYRKEIGEVRRERKQPGTSAPAESPSAAGVAPMGADDPLRNAPQMLRRPLREAYASAANTRLASAIATETPFPERLVHFWSNHFAISADKLPVIPIAGNFEFEAIRPNVMGSFADLLEAAVLHPAMLIYLDQAQSVGPGSPAAQRIAARQGQRKAGLNENLGREVMELHTLGVRTGYSQADVTEFARALTGWTVAGQAGGRGGRMVNAPIGDSVFAAALHEPGSRSIMGKTYAEGGAAQARAVMKDLARHPATARHIATKLARHFIADVPPPGAVARLEQAFLSSGGDLPTVYRALVGLPEAWQLRPGKFRTPWDWTVAAMRATDTEQLPGRQAALGLLQQLGQPIWRPGSPAGWADTMADWAGPGALMTRVEIAQQIATRVGDRIDARRLASILLADAGANTQQAIARSESPALGLALLLSAPEFLRR